MSPPKKYRLNGLTFEELCATQDYSVLFNGNGLTKDIEFKFKFEPAVEVQDGDTIKLGLSNIVTTLLNAAGAGKLNDEDIGEYLEQLEGTGEK